VTAPHEGVRARRARLIERAATERDTLAREFAELQQPLRTVERGLGIYRGLRRSMPVIGLGAGIAMAALAFIRPKGISGWVRGATEIWRLISERKRDRARAAEPAAPPSPAVGEVVGG
jgi:hypothetical protein